MTKPLCLIPQYCALCRHALVDVRQPVDVMGKATHVRMLRACPKCRVVVRVHQTTGLQWCKP